MSRIVAAAALARRVCGHARLGSIHFAAAARSFRKATRRATSRRMRRTRFEADLSRSRCYARRENGTTYEVGTTSKDVWRYKRSSGQFPAVLTFEKGC